MLALALASAAPAVAQAQAEGPESALIITAVFDGPLLGGQPKGIELYVREAVPDLSVYGLRAVNKPDEAVAAPEWLFPAGYSATAGTFLYVVNQRPKFLEYTGLSTDFGTVAMSINGDDAILLYRDSIVVNRFGELAEAGGTPSWSYLDGYAYRRQGSAGSGSEFAAREFEFSGAGALSSCSEATNSTCDNTIPFGSYSEAALPVSLTAFTAEATATGALLTWTTGSETGSDYFAVELSRDGDAFAELDRVAAAGTTTAPQQYAFDYPTAAGGLHYFRLRQVDLDGSAEYSQTVAVNFGSDASTSGLRVVAATRAGGLAVETERSRTGLTVVSMTGAVVARYQIGAPGRHDVPLEGLPAGLYIVSDGRVARRFMLE